MRQLTEAPVGIRDLINAYFAVTYPSAPPLTLGPLLDRLRESVIVQEQHLVRKLRFRLEVVYPHGFLVNYAKTFGFPPATVKTAWAVLNDSLGSSICIRFVGHVLAAAALVAAEKLQGSSHQIPHSVGLAQSQLKWYNVCDVTERQLDECCRELLGMYSALR